MARHIYQDRTEGLTGDTRELKLEDLRALVRELITDGYGSISWSRARDLGKEVTPNLAASTVQQFASGDTKNPSVPYTVLPLAAHVKKHEAPQVWIVPAGAMIPKGAILVA